MFRFVVPVVLCKFFTYCCVLLSINDEVLCYSIVCDFVRMEKCHPAKNYFITVMINIFALIFQICYKSNSKYSVFKAVLLYYSGLLFKNMKPENV
jgi:hypothetical protein